jgi:hypothetical protein
LQILNPMIISQPPRFVAVQFLTHSLSKNHSYFA